MSEKPLDCVGISQDGIGKHDFRLDIEHGEHGVYATSPDLKGLFVAGKSVEEVVAELPNVLLAMLKAVMHERDILRAGFIKASEVCNDYAVHLHCRGGSLDPIPECVEAKKLLDRGARLAACNCPLPYRSIVPEEHHEYCPALER